MPVNRSLQRKYSSSLYLTSYCISLFLRTTNEKEFQLSFRFLSCQAFATRRRVLVSRLTSLVSVPIEGRTDRCPHLFRFGPTSRSGIGARLRTLRLCRLKLVVSCWTCDYFCFVPYLSVVCFVLGVRHSLASPRVVNAWPLLRTSLGRTATYVTTTSKYYLALNPKKHRLLTIYSNVSFIITLIQCRQIGTGIPEFTAMYSVFQ